ncbi:MAG TPA: PKD domain-containing protein, partial [Burkholderiales bacterium]|nr:PKD domain-containing protein [Burkholderiales bacterium]
MQRKTLVQVLFASVLFSISCLCFGQDFRVELRSEPGDWIGLGTPRSFTPENSSVYGLIRNAEGGIEFMVEPFGATDIWHFEFTAPRNQPLVPDNYEEAQRFPFNAFPKPGLTVTGEHRACNQVTGRYVVHEAVYGPAGEVLSFAIDLEHHCEGFPPALWGVLRYNSQVPLVVTTPNAAAGPDKTIDEGASFTLDGSKSSDGDGTIASYRWTQLSGPPVTLATPGAARTDFVAPQVGEGGADLVFRLDVADNDGQTDSDTVTIHVADEFDPKSTLSLVGEPGDIMIGENRYFFTINEGVFFGTRDMGDSIALRFDSEPSSSVYMNFGAPGNVRLAPGTYEGATRYPFQAPTAPGIAVWPWGASCNEVNGRFVVHDARYGADGNIESFAADFFEKCDVASGGISGTILYNYRKPKPFPVLVLGVTDAPDPVQARSQLTYHIRLRNDGAVAATGVSTSTTLPSQVSFVSASAG